MTFDEFRKTELRVGKIFSADRVEGSDKLLKLKVGFGDATTGTRTEGSPASPGQIRQIVAGIGRSYRPEELLGREIVVVMNLEPRTFTLRNDSGPVIVESQGMLLAACDATGAPVVLTVDRDVPPGTPVS